MNTIIGTSEVNTRRRIRSRTTRSITVVILSLVILAAALWPRRAGACGPFFTDAIFVFTKHPDFPLENFATGKLGVISSTWARSYLVAAYRTLSGSPLSEGEAKAIESLWDDRLSLKDVSDDTWTKKWIEARKQVPGAAALEQLETYRAREKPHEYEQFLNCQQDAFQNAVAILDERIKRFGRDSKQVSDWLAAQDLVFANCREGAHVPEAAAPDQDSIARADRAYQIAAANFYATNFDVARQQFDAIAADKESRYRVFAPYLSARALLRKGSLAEKAEDAAAPLTEAEKRLNAILKDSSLQVSHHAAARLLNLTRLRLYPEEKLHELAHAIVTKKGSDDFKQTVWDYTYLMDDLIGEDEEGNKRQIPAEITSDDLSDWIVAIQSQAPGIEAHALERWQHNKSLPWLVAAIENAKGDQANLNSLLTAAANLKPSSPAFASLTFHRVRLLSEAHRLDEARALLDQALASEAAQFSPSALNLLLSQRMMMAQNLNEFLKDAQRAPAGFSDDYDGREIPEDPKEAEQTSRGSKYFFDMDAVNIFNKAMPVAVLKDGALSKTLAPNLRKDVAQAAFMRAALLDDRASALQAAPIVREYYPQAAEFLTAYEKATTPEARRFAAAFLSLKLPGLRPFVTSGIGRSTAVDDIDSYRDNYWCSEPPAQQNNAVYSEETQEQSKTQPVVPPDFLKASQSLAQEQFANLKALGTAPNYLCKIAIEWAEKNPTDPRAPEALHLAVRSTRYGCTDKETGRWSKAAFDLLHRRYPNTNWANATKYWFKG